MVERWDIARFQNDHPNSFDKLGQQFIDEIQINIREINDLFCQRQFSKSLNNFTDISCQSKKVSALSLGEAANNLKTFLDKYMEVVEGIIQQGDNFDYEQERSAAFSLISLMEIARDTINDWQIFRNQPQLPDLFAKEIKQLRDTYNDLPNQDCQICQLCSFCQLI
ncbi:unnamed protein product (macronuclear) [Paramecium tetraurelia]|uniref:Uncharacterized protein n=1 Tax=Paramecium tetraurelia TaxID=5888 RepID=A0DAR4_PARTE|nr:uncharacterized protein GSPATT00015038001 [Paramecium tetraurelia]CAK80131.1 unnamed protein product [Paramecium tetraurelia]|eukprot:XP_001447528.1 hypothetical protein (macronuclear) [Paramecium tetraurelia strain d4-2]